MPSRWPPAWRSRTTPILGAVVAVLAAGLAISWAPRVRKQARSVALLVSGDTAGWIAPCGCTSNQSGGLPRRGTYVEGIRRDRGVILVDAGGAPGGTSIYDRIKFEAILKGERLMGSAAHNLGGPEAAFGAETLREIRKATGAPFVSANLRDRAGRLVAEPLRTVVARDLRVALVGVLSTQFAREGLRIDEPRDAVLSALASAPPHDALVVLAYLPEAELRSLAAALPEADLVMGGPTGQSIAPTRVGTTWLASATNKGKFLVHMEALRPASRGDATWSGRVIEMSSEIPDRPAQMHNLSEFRAVLAERDLPADQTGLAPPLPVHRPAGYQVAGTESCRKCHSGDCQTWTESGHARAWRVLQAKGDHVDASCQSCHTTGFGLPGGFQSARRTQERTAVGCESCHGPSLAHARRPGVKTPFPAQHQCTSCHDAENSPQFAYEAYWHRIRHGATANPVSEELRR